MNALAELLLFSFDSAIKILDMAKIGMLLLQLCLRYNGMPQAAYLNQRWWEQGFAEIASLFCGPKPRGCSRRGHAGPARRQRKMAAHSTGLL